MIHLGDIGRAAAYGAPSHALGLANTYVGDISRCAPYPPQPKWRGRNSWSAKAPMLLDCVGAILGDNVCLLEYGQLVDVHRVGVEGHAYFYDMDDGIYHAASSQYEMAWRIVIEEGVPTVTALTGGLTGEPEPMYSAIG